MKRALIGGILLVAGVCVLVYIIYLADMALLTAVGRALQSVLGL